jgi:ABC-type multidrug transport system fused ATPase/permease subunit
MTNSTLGRLRFFYKNFLLVLGPGSSKLPLLWLLMLGITFMDVAALAMIAPFISRIIGSDQLLTNPFGSLTANWSLSKLGSIMLAAFIVKAVATILLQYFITSISRGERARLMSRLLHSFQMRPYEFHLQRSSADLANVVIWHTETFTSGVLSNALQMISNGLLFLILCIFLALTDLQALMIMTAVLTALFVAITKWVRPFIARAAFLDANLYPRILEAVNHSLHGVREIRLLGQEGHFRNELDTAAAAVVRASVIRESFSLIPRQAIELAMISILVLLSWIAHLDGAVSTVIPVLGTFATAAMRLLPASTSLLSCWTGFSSSIFVVRTLADELRSVPADKSDVGASVAAAPAVFSMLELRDVCFRYEGKSRHALDHASLQIKQGQCVGVIGKSGSGKSTLADVVLGLLKPSSGLVMVNGVDIANDLRAWQSMTAYIPQNIFLINGNLRQNIALGVPEAEVDEQRLLAAVESAQLTELVSHLEQGLDTEIGERGIRLSGGQRQRIAIARALYHQRQFLVLDEATSALDTETEEAITDAISKLAGKVTIIVIAHRTSTLASCDSIVEMKDGCLFT